MTLADTQVIEVMAATVPDHVDLTNTVSTTEFITAMADIAGYTLCEVSRNIDAIISRAKELRLERADAR